MISTCPDCEMPMRSRVCACGYSLPAAPPPMPDYVVPDSRPASYGSYRERWYAERGLPYQSPRASAAFVAAKRMLRQRTPGDDDDEISEAA